MPITSRSIYRYGRSTGLCKMLVKHFEATELFTSDTKYFTSTQIQGILCQAALQQTSIEDIADAEQQKKEDETSPTAETTQNAIIAHFRYFSPYEFGKYASSLFHDAIRSSPRYQKLRHER